MPMTWLTSVRESESERHVAPGQLKDAKIAALISAEWTSAARAVQTRIVPGAMTAPVAAAAAVQQLPRGTSARPGQRGVTTTTSASRSLPQGRLAPRPVAEEPMITTACRVGAALRRTTTATRASAVMAVTEQADTTTSTVETRGRLVTAGIEVTAGLAGTGETGPTCATADLQPVSGTMPIVAKRTGAATQDRRPVQIPVRTDPSRTPSCCQRSSRAKARTSERAKATGQATNGTSSPTLITGPSLRRTNRLPPRRYPRLRVPSGAIPGLAATDEWIGTHCRSATLARTPGPVLRQSRSR